MENFKKTVKTDVVGEPPVLRSLKVTHVVQFMDARKAYVTSVEARNERLPDGSARLVPSPLMTGIPPKYRAVISRFLVAKLCPEILNAAVASSLTLEESSEDGASVSSASTTVGYQDADRDVVPSANFLTEEVVLRVFDKLCERYVDKSKIPLSEIVGRADVDWTDTDSMGRVSNYFADLMEELHKNCLDDMWEAEAFPTLLDEITKWSI